jgi:hypothetical protein
MLCQASAAGALDMKKIEADLSKGAADKVWTAKVVADAVKKCGGVAGSTFCYIYFLVQSFTVIKKKQRLPLLRSLLAM